MATSTSRNPEGPWMLIGAGGHARSVSDVITRAGERLLGLCSSSAARPAWLPESCLSLDDDELESFSMDARWLVAIGDCATRRRFTERLEQSGRTLGTLVARTSTVASDAVIGAGSMVLEHAHVGPGSLIGTSTIINTAAVVEHDCRIGSFSHIGPGCVVLGGGSVGHSTFVGSAAVVLPGVGVGDDAVVGAGAVVTRPVPDHVVVRGVPARE